MLYSSLDYARGLTILGLIPVLIGIPLYLKNHQPKKEPTTPPVSHSD